MKLKKVNENKKEKTAQIPEPFLRIVEVVKHEHW